MSKLTLKDLSEKMKGIDIAAFATITDGHVVAGRPMSNNGEVDYDGDSWFFAFDGSRVVSDVERDKKAQLTFQGKSGLMGKPGVFVSVQGGAEVIRDREHLEEHWHRSLERWAPDGLETPGLVLIKVKAHRIHYWDGGDEGEILAAG